MNDRGSASRAAWMHAMMAAYHEAGRQLDKQRKGRRAAAAAKEAEEKLALAEKAYAEAVAAQEAADQAAAATLTKAQRAEAAQAAADDVAAKEAGEKEAAAKQAEAEAAAAREAVAREAAAKEAAAKEAAAKAEAEAAREAAEKEAAARDAAAREVAAKEAAAMLAAEAEAAAKEQAAREAAERQAAADAAAQAFVAPDQPPHDQSEIGGVITILKAIVYSGLLVAYLVLEVLVSMLAYMYLNLYQIQTFGYLIGLSHRLLNEFAVQLERVSPTIANQAYATILGELGAKSILLLFIGLAVSAGIRFLLWLVNEGVELLFRPRPGAPVRPEVPTSAAA